MRLFTAIELPPDARRHAGSMIEELHRQWKTLFPPPARMPREPNWTATENLHITLKFLGEVPDADVPALCAALKTAAVAPPQLPAQVQIDRLLCFPLRGPVRIIAAGLSGDIKPLQQLFTNIESQLAAMGIPRERRAYTPHITLGRCRLPLPRAAREKLAKMIESHLPGPVIAISEFTLIQSVLTSQRPQYVTLAKMAC